jgi:hypothetical protein
MKTILVFSLLSILVFSSANTQEGDTLLVEVSVDKGDEAVYYDGESISISFRANEDVFLTLFNIDTEGDLSLLFPESREDEGFIRANTTYQIPAEEDDYTLKVRGPSGDEYLCAVVSREPHRIPALFNGEEGESRFQVEGDREEAINDIIEEILEGSREGFAVDVCYFSVECCDERVPPFHHFPIGCGLEIISHPGGAKIYLDGRYFGKTPAIIGGIPPGVHTVCVKKTCYYTFTEKVTLKEGETERVKVNMKWKLW